MWNAAQVTSPPEALTREAAAILRGLMSRHGIEQSEAAPSVLVSQSQLSKISRGVARVDLDTFARWCWMLGATPASVLAEAWELSFRDMDLEEPFILEGRRNPARSD